MGTWNAPDTETKKERLKAILKEVAKLEDELYDLFGDDILMDHLTMAKERIEWAIEAEWTQIHED